ncbi:MAG TPA: hypothetical protein VGF67_18255 [Ktedonobacteraceae bacterium]|jgi:hypothetical protein
MFTVQQRDRVRQYVLAMARSDPRVTGGALIGSKAAGAEDCWSDIDLTFGIAAGHAIEPVMDDWTRILEQEFGVLDHFDLRAGSSLYRVFLLPDGLEIDLSVTPAEAFGARGPHFQMLFGSAAQPEALPPAPEPGQHIGLGWHHVCHARSCIERNRPWQAAYWIDELRNHTLVLACIRLGENPAYGRGIDRLPTSVTDPLVATFVRSLDQAEVRRALAVATHCLLAEIAHCDPAHARRLEPLLHEIGMSRETDQS